MWLCLTLVGMPSSGASCVGLTTATGFPPSFQSPTPSPRFQTLQDPGPTSQAASGKPVLLMWILWPKRAGEMTWAKLATVLGVS